MKDCIFCKIIKGEISAKIIYEDKSSLSFLDINPHSPAHTIVIPKKHVATILDLDDDNEVKLFTAVKKSVNLINESLRPDGFTIGINHGQAAGQAIEHLHVHILPRFFNDGGGSIHSIVLNKPKESLEEIYHKIKNYGN